MSEDKQKLRAATTLPLSATVREAIKIIDATRYQIALITDDQYRIVGSVTDGDIRRGILKGFSLDANVNQVMNPSPKVVQRGTPIADIQSLMKKQMIRQVPVVDESGRLLSIHHDSHFNTNTEKPNSIILMAGGLGKRLGSLTNELPKPMLCVGEKPILETIISQFKKQGYSDLVISVNYLGEKIREHFGDGKQFGVNIRYIFEDQPLGTCGALNQFSGALNYPCLVMNADILTTLNFDQLLEFHCTHDAEATMCVREYSMEVPYGVVTVDEQNLVHIHEKPIHNFYVNAGIYVLSEKAIGQIPRGQRFDMTNLFSALAQKNMQAIVFPLREYWLDIGRIDDFQKAQEDYSHQFQ